MTKREARKWALAFLALEPIDISASIGDAIPQMSERDLKKIDAAFADLQQEFYRRATDRIIDAWAENRLPERRRADREARLTALGFEDLTDDQRKANLDTNLGYHNKS